MISCSVIIPCFNEEAALPRLLEGVKQFGTCVLVVDDGSTDETASIARAAGVELLRNQTRLGKGASLRRGIDWAMSAGLTHALCMDGDGQHSPTDIPKFLGTGEAEAALIVGNRMDNAGEMPWLRRRVNQWMSGYLSKRTGTWLPDTQCGMRLVSLKWWKRLDMQTCHFEFESELILRMIAAGGRIEFVPIEVIYKGERSKIHPLKDTVRWFRWLRQQSIQSGSHKEISSKSQGVALVKS
ncbi:MAG: glycosyltransferase family 2 protein [Verrucomicrobiota bacterium]|nr:glycosyltransferase family 2 protein [Verrucomicrobiota bacterium]